jgi:formylglycine-generating enzyme
MQTDMKRHPPPAPTAGVTWIPAGEFAMGSADFYPEERPVHQVALDGFWIDTRPVTVAEFRRFVKQTGHVTVAEQPPDPSAYPGARPDLLVPGSLVFQKAPSPVDLRDYANWWAYVPGAMWRHPEGPGSDVSKRDKHPVTHVAYADARAFADWVGKDLPTEAEWEYAARAGSTAAGYGALDSIAWYAGNSGSEHEVGQQQANGFGLYDMLGNVWEWVADWYDEKYYKPSPATDPAGPATGQSQVRRGGSWFDLPRSVRASFRGGDEPANRTFNVGFRCAGELR